MERSTPTRIKVEYIVSIASLGENKRSKVDSLKVLGARPAIAKMRSPSRLEDAPQIVDSPESNFSVNGGPKNGKLFVWIVVICEKYILIMGLFVD